MRSIAEYLGREIFLAHWSSSRDGAELSLADSSVLLWLGRRGSPDLDETQLAPSLLARGPLAVFVGGGGAERIFDCMLKILDEGVIRRIPLTRFSEGSITDCVEEFFQGTWPPEDSFEEWQRYVIIVLADTREVEDAVLTLLGTSRA